MRYEDPLKILEIMRLLEEQTLSLREIAVSVGCGKTTVSEIHKRSKEQGLTYPEAKEMTSLELRMRLYPKLTQVPVKEDPDWEDIHTRLIKYPRLNLQFIWTEEYRPENPDGLSYSQFCRRYHKWGEKAGREVTMVREHTPGKEMFVDWAGDTLDLIIDGKVTTAHFFITALGASGYPYVEAFPNEQEASWLMGHVHAFEWYGGIPRIVIPDNTKTAVTKPNYYDPALNRSYCDLAKHYMVGVIPARVKKPRDKPLVEGTVGWIETWLLEWLRGGRYFSFEELNAEIRKRIRQLASKQYEKKPGSRQSIFDSFDKPALRALPTRRYEHASYAVRRVPDNYHVEYDGFYYSAPYTLFKQNVTLRATLSMVEVISMDGERVGLHQRHFSGSRYITADDHMPEKHRKQKAFDRRNGDNYRSWAMTVGENTYLVIDALLKAQTVEETAYKSCMGIMQMVNRFGTDELEAACGKARAIGSVTYTTIKRLINSLSEPPAISEPTLAHENLRDPSEFN